MKRLSLFIINRHQDILRYLLIIVAALIISYLFPRTVKFKYEFEQQRPWRYENLIAPFDFGILKAEEEIEAEVAAIEESFIPYYLFDTTVIENQEEYFIQNFNQAYTELKNDTLADLEIDSLQYIQTGLKLLEDIYSTGIISIAAQHEGNPEREIIVLKKNMAEKRKIGSFYTLKKAYTYMRETLEKNPGVENRFLMPLLQASLANSVVYDEAKSEDLITDLVDNISITRGMVQKEEMIIGKGNIVTPEKYQILLSFKQEYEKRVVGSKKSYIIFLGYFIITMIVLGIFILFLKLLYTAVFISIRKLIFVLLVMILMIIIVKIFVNADIPVLFAIPFSILPIILRTFFGTRLAMHAHVAVLLLAGFLIPIGFGFIFLQFAAGMIAIFSNVRAQYWSDFFLSCLYILITYFIGYFAISVIHEGSIHNIDLYIFGWLTLNVLLTLLAYPLIPIFEKLFGFVSEITLLELADINKPLLKELSLKAPGTFQHSLQVSNLSEAAASEIGANALLVKVGALYHDVGKMDNPAYFIENQNFDINPHDELSFEVSAKMIIDHVKKGIKKAKKYNLPDILIDFIRTHHGTSRVEYFYQSYLKNFPSEQIDDAIFRYPGPLPYSKETAILMMADSVEAASRSLKNPTSEDIERLVEKIINYKIEQNQFINSDITFKDITTVKKILKKMLNSIYHVRIPYPEEERLAS